MLRIWREDLNKKNDDYKSHIDCLDPKIGLYHQIRGKLYDPINKYWHFSRLRGEYYKTYEDMVCYCISKDGEIIERIYIILRRDIICRTSINISNNENKHWYEQYRVSDKDELKKANDIWKKLNSYTN